MLTKRRTTCTSNTSVAARSQHDFAHLIFSGYIIRNIKMCFYYSNSTNRLQVTDFIKLYFSNFAAVIRCSTNTLLCHTTTQIHSSLKRICFSQKILDMAHCTPTQHQAGHAQGTHPIHLLYFKVFLSNLNSVIRVRRGTSLISQFCVPVNCLSLGKYHLF